MVQIETKYDMTDRHARINLRWLAALVVGVIVAVVYYAGLAWVALWLFKAAMRMVGLD